MQWQDEREIICDQVATNVQDYFHFRLSEPIEVCASRNKTVETVLGELRTMVRDHAERPFTYLRIKDLADFGPPTREEYAENNGKAYIQALFQLANVSSSMSVFEDFDALLDAKSSDGIRLEPVEWTDEPVMPEKIKF